jgi:hypothetical protein
MGGALGLTIQEFWQRIAEIGITNITPLDDDSFQGLTAQGGIAQIPNPSKRTPAERVAVILLLSMKHARKS